MLLMVMIRVNGIRFVLATLAVLIRVFFFVVVLKAVCVFIVFWRKLAIAPFALCHHSFCIFTLCFTADVEDL